MSSWTKEKHQQARMCASHHHDSKTQLRRYLNEALDELVRLRPALAGGLVATRDEKIELLAHRIWTAVIEVGSGEDVEIPELEDLDDSEAKALGAITDAVHSAVCVMLSRRHAAVPRPAGSEGEVP